MTPPPFAYTSGRTPIPRSRRTFKDSTGILETPFAQPRNLQGQHKKTIEYLLADHSIMSLWSSHLEIVSTADVPS